MSARVKKKEPRLLLLQHPGFGAEIRSLLNSTEHDKETAGIVAQELMDLSHYKALGQRHKKEDVLQGEFSEIGYLRLYPKGRSLRPYFTVIEGVIWNLALDDSKTKTKLSDRMKDRLRHRLRETKSYAAEQGRQS